MTCISMLSWSFVNKHNMALLPTGMWGWSSWFCAFKLFKTRNTLKKKKHVHYIVCQVHSNLLLKLENDPLIFVFGEWLQIISKVNTFAIGEAQLGNSTCSATSDILLNGDHECYFQKTISMKHFAIVLRKRLIALGLCP